MLPPEPETVRERIETILADPDGGRAGGPAYLAVLVKLEPLVTRLEPLRLEPALRDFLESCVDWPSERLKAMFARLGWGGSPLCTLDGAGAMVGVSLERMRQYERKRQRRMPDQTVYLPALDRPLRALAEPALLAHGAVGPLLQELGIAEGAFSAESLLQAAEHLQPPHEFHLVRRVPASYLARTDQVEEIAALQVQFGCRISARGFVSLTEARVQADDAGGSIADRVPEALGAMFPEHSVHED